MQGQMMDFQLTLPMLLRRSEAYYGAKEIVTRLPDKSWHRTTHGDAGRRARALAVALAGLGLERGDRVATLCWNHYAHHEAYLGVPCGGFVLHTLNLRLHPNDLAYIASHAGDKVVIVDRSLKPLLDQFVGRTEIRHVIVVEDDYEDLLAGADPDAWIDPELDENEAAAMCYTSGTTGMPKGVVYSHRSTMLHTLGISAGNPLGIGLSEQDAILPVVPMFHANAWGYPYIATAMGAKLVYPGPHLDPETLLADFVEEGVTWAAGVPTIWLGILGMLDAEPDRWDLTQMKGMLVGGSAAPRSLIAGFKQRHDIIVIHGWGMTETSPVASTAQLPGDLASLDEEAQFDFIAMQGLPLPLVELRNRDADGNLLPWDGESMGELEVRGPWVAASYYETPDAADRWTEDGWFKTGDVVSIHPRGFIQIKDRSKDVIKSGGEWISSVELENALMAHPAIAEAAVIAVPDAKWDERPLAAVVLREGKSATGEELREFLAPNFAKWWLPDRFEFVAEIPKTSVGKFKKTELREMFANVPADVPRGRVVIETVWLDNPPVNAVNSRILETLWNAFESLGDDVRAVVLRGQGERAFSAGADISGFVGGIGEGDRPGGIQPVADLIESAPVPVVAAIHGYCLGGGLEIALACDFRIATRDAQLGFPEVNLGLLPGGGGTQRAPRLISPGRARWLTMSGERIPAETAEAWGLVEFLVDDLEEGIARYVEPLDRQSPHAIRQIKQLFHDTRDRRSDEREVEAFAACLSSEDGQEGVAAFLEKRTPSWTGR